MKIASYIPNLTFMLYLDFAGCSFGPPVSWNTGQRPPPAAPYWKDMVSLGVKIRVKKDPNLQGKMIDIMLREGQELPPMDAPGLLYCVNDPVNNIEYVVHKNFAGETLALSPVTKQFRETLKEFQNKQQQEERPHKNKQQQEERPYKNKQQQEVRPYKNKQQGERPYKNKQQEERPYKNKQQGERPHKNKQQQEEPLDKNEQQQEEQPRENKQQERRLKKKQQTMFI